MFLVFTVVVSWVEYRISVLSIDPVTLFDLIHESVLEAWRLPLVLDTSPDRPGAGGCRLPGRVVAPPEVRFHDHVTRPGNPGARGVGVVRRCTGLADDAVAPWACPWVRSPALRPALTMTITRA